MKRLAALLLAAGCARGAAGPARDVPLRSQYPGNLERARPLTRAERSRFTETSRYADVVQFLDSIKALGGNITVGSIGKTTEGRDIPFVVASRPAVATAEEAHRLHRPIVYVQANIHAGEVEGKEALQALLRDLVFGQRSNVLDSIVLVAVPIYNADGNERVAAQERNRGEQNGPELVGTRANAQGLDLNRDYVKAEAPETRASLAMFGTWDPDVFVDLHTTDGSYHGYALTYAPSLNPAARITGPYTRDTMLVTLRARMRERHGFEVFDYGNFRSQDSAAAGWFTYDSRPRFGTNYMGVRGRIAVLSEAYSHDPFMRRVASTYDFVSELLSYVAENADDVVDLAREADTRTVGWGNDPRTAPIIPLRAALTSVITAPVRVEESVRTGDSIRYEAGLPRGVRRTGKVQSVRMPVYDRFTPTLAVPMSWGYAFPASAGDSLLPRLAQHGIVVEVLEEPANASAQRFAIDSTTHAPRPFQGHVEERVFGSWSAAASTPLAAGSFVVRAGQARGILATYLLEPQSDDGFAAWNVLDPLAAAREFPVVRIVQPIAARLRALSPPAH